MELNREQIIKALECCTSCSCGVDCPYYDSTLCQYHIMRDALSLIKELTEENERLRADNEIKSQKRANIFEIVNAFERGRTDGVRKMQERLINYESYDNGGGNYVVSVDDIRTVAKEMLKEDNNND